MIKLITNDNICSKYSDLKSYAKKEDTVDQRITSLE